VIARTIIVGGGLSGGLAALALAESGRGGAVTLLEECDSLGGNHTWSFHETDLEADERALVAPFVVWRWPAQTVRFPGRERTLPIGYASVTSDRFDEIAGERLTRAGCSVLSRARAVHVGARAVRLSDGRVLRADIVIDARGPMRPAGAAGFQKFIGLELDLESDGPWTAPVVMDATVPQVDGYRFVYVLPFTRRRVLVEDTFYSDGPELDADQVARGAVAYVTAHGARVAGVRRRESGVLPLPLETGGAEPTPGGGPLRIGYRAGFFHPGTGYSLPLAVRGARALAEAPSVIDMRRALAALARRLAPQRRFGCLLNRLLFRAMRPTERWTALDRFYRMPDAIIARFYGSRSTALDRMRLLLGRPPAGVSWRRLLGFAEAA